MAEITKNLEAKKKSIKKSFWNRVFRFLKDRILLDFISLVPFPYILRGHIELKYGRLLYLLKTVRLHHGFELIDYHTFTRQLKQLQGKRIDMYQFDPELAENQIDDLTKISQIMFVS